VQATERVGDWSEALVSNTWRGDASLNHRDGLKELETMSASDLADVVATAPVRLIRSASHDGFCNCFCYRNLVITMKC
jgi:hypothetical protein